MGSGLQRGGAMIELAFAFLGLAFFIVGATDIARIFQARGAVQAAVQEGLRCVYPLDASCGTHAPNAPAPILFDVWVGKTSQQYAIQQEYLNMSARWSTEQRWRAQQEATLVESVTVQRSQTRYAQQEVSYPIDAHAVYIVQTSDLPIVGGGDPLAPVFWNRVMDRYREPNVTTILHKPKVPERDQKFVAISKLTNLKHPPPTIKAQQPIHPSKEAESDQQNDGLSNEVYYDDALKIGSVSVSIADAWQGQESLSSAVALLAKYKATLRCYQSPLSSDGGSSVVLWEAAGAPEPCVYRSSAPDAIFDGSVLKVPLMFHVSGRVLPGTEADDLQPGKLVVKLTWVSPTSGSDVIRLGGRLISKGGDERRNLVVRGADWSDLAEHAQAAHKKAGYSPEINRHHTLGPIPIDAQVSLEFFLSSADGRSVGWEGGELRVFFPTFELAQERFPCGYSADPAQCVTPPKDVAVSYSAVSASAPLKLKEVGSSVCRLQPPPSFEAAPTTVLQQLKTQIVSGITPPPLKFWTRSSSALACDTVSATNDCPDSLRKKALRGCKPEAWSEEALLKECGFSGSLPNDAKLEVKYRTALLNEYIESGECSGPQLPSCSLPYRQDVGRSVLAETSAACPAQVVTTPVETFGPYLKSSCSGSGHEAQIEGYRAKYRVPTSVKVSAATSPADDYVSEEKPTDKCLVVEEEEVRKEVQCGARVASAAVEGCCREARGDCRYKQALAESKEPSDSMQAAFQQAIGRTVETVRAAFPAAQPEQSCADKEPYCLEVSGELVDNNARAQMSAKVHVPLRLLSAVGWQGTTVSYQEARVLERTRMAGSDFVN